jgi:hypothetical protein
MAEPTRRSDMTNVARAKNAPVLAAEGCRCGWGKHCRCLEGQARFYRGRLVGQMRAFVRAGGDLAERRRVLAVMRESVDSLDRLHADTDALHTLYDVLPRRKDIDLVQRITCDDFREPQTDEEIAAETRTPLEHVRFLRTCVVATYEGRTLPVPRGWRQAAAERRARERAIKAARRAAR